MTNGRDVFNMSNIVERILEPAKIYAGSSFRLKLKVKDGSLLYRQIVSEDNQVLITEDGEQIITEWSV